jgi:hypothetical protein
MRSGQNAAAGITRLARTRLSAEVPDAQSQRAGVLCRQRLCHIGEGKSDEGTYHLLERKAAWPQQQAKMRPQAHR